MRDVERSFFSALLGGSSPFAETAGQAAAPDLVNEFCLPALQSSKTEREALVRSHAGHRLSGNEALPNGISLEGSERFKLGDVYSVLSSQNCTLIIPGKHAFDLARKEFKRPVGYSGWGRNLPWQTGRFCRPEADYLLQRGDVVGIGEPCATVREIGPSERAVTVVKMYIESPLVPWRGGR